MSSSPERLELHQRSFEMPALTPESFDDLFVIKPSNVDAWMNVINNRTPDLMKLGVYSDERLQSYTETLKDLLDLPPSSADVMAAGVMFGARIAGGSPNVNGAKIAFQSFNASFGLHYFYRLYPEGATREDKLAAVRNYEIRVFGSDVLATTLPSVQPHIEEHFPSDNGFDNQIKFYAGAVIGAIAVLPEDLNTRHLSPILIRDGLSSEINTKQDMATAQTKKDTAFETIKRSFESEIIFERNDQGEIQVRNGRRIQQLANATLTYQDDASIVISPDMIDRTVIKTEDNDVIRFKLVDGAPHELVEDESIVAITQNGSSEVTNLLYHAYHQAHPHFDVIRSIIDGDAATKSVLVNASNIGQISNYVSAIERDNKAIAAIKVGLAALAIGYISSLSVNKRIAKSTHLKAGAAAAVLALGKVKQHIDIDRLKKSHVRYVTYQEHVSRKRLNPNPKKYRRYEYIRDAKIPEFHSDI